MSENEQTESSGSEPELCASSSNFDPLKALYAEKIKLPVENAPMYENIQQYEAAQKSSSIILPVGMGKLVKKREEEKEMRKKKEEQELEEKNKQRFAKFGELSELVAQKKVKKKQNVVTRMLSMQGPLGALKTCVDQRLRIKVITRHATGIRGELHATCVAFDKQWNLALTDVLEIWKRKGPRKRKVPPGMGTPIEKGTAATISAVPVVTETPLGKGIWECTRHISQMMVRGEHVVLVNIVER